MIHDCIQVLLFMSQGAFWSLMVGLVLGVTRFILEFVYPPPLCGEEDTRPANIANVHFLYFAIILFGIVCLVAIVVSYMTTPIDEQHVSLV